MKISRVFPLLALCGIFAMMAFVPGKNKKNRAAKKTGKTAVIKNAVAATTKENPYYIIIDKSDYELKVYDAEGWYATYPIVFGSKDLGDKMKEGDKRTPDGHFKVIEKKIHSKWSYMLLLDYPNNECLQRFNERKQRGLLPKNAKIGGGIAIHATRPQEEWTVDNFYNWTDGCVSVKYTEMKDLFSFIPVGTPGNDTAVKLLKQRLSILNARVFVGYTSSTMNSPGGPPPMCDPPGKFTNYSSF